MANRLSMAKVTSIETLHRSGHSNREIARLLGVDRGTVNAYVRRLKATAAEQNRPNPQTGSETTEVSDDSLGGNPQNRPNSEAATAAPPSVQNRPNPQTGSALDAAASPALLIASGPKSLCDGYREVIEAKLDQGLSLTRIHQDLVDEHGFTGSYYSVRRLAQRLGQQSPLPFRRLEVEPGEEAQIDFGTGAWVVGDDGKKRRPWMFRIVLSCSRKAYSEVVWQQTTDNFIAAIENAFHYFGGVPKSTKWMGTKWMGTKWMGTKWLGAKWLGTK